MSMDSSRLLSRRLTKGHTLDMRKTVTPITSIDQLDLDEVEIDDCEGGACPVR